jgi:hypothetical protein
VRLRVLVYGVVVDCIEEAMVNSPDDYLVWINGYPFSSIEEAKEYACKLERFAFKWATHKEFCNSRAVAQYPCNCGLAKDMEFMNLTQARERIAELELDEATYRAEAAQGYRD